MAQTWGTPNELSDAQIARYLTHIGLEAAATRTRPADRALLAEVQLAHLLHVPFDNSALHLPADVTAGDATLFAHMRGPGIRADVPGAFAQVVERGRGGYCFVLNGLFAALLRALGFTVSELAARVYPLRNKDPAEAGWAWTPITHMCLIVDTLAEGRFLCDVGFGGGNCPRPVPFVDGARMQSVAKSETFELRHEPLPGSDPRYFPDQAAGWTLYRHFAPAPDGSAPGHASPCYHFSLQSLADVDFEALSYYSSHSPQAPFTKELLVTRLHADGARDVLQCPAGATCAKLYRRDGVAGKIEPGTEEDVPLTNAAILDACRRRFGFP